MTHQMLEQINQSMDLNFLNQNSEVNFMKLVDLEILDQNFFMDDNADQQKSNNLTKSIKQRRKYSAIKVKARNFLTNISHKRLSKKDLISKSFITDCFAFILIYLNPFSLEKKFENINIVFYQKTF